MRPQTFAEVSAARILRPELAGKFSCPLPMRRGFNGDVCASRTGKGGFARAKISFRIRRAWRDFPLPRAISRAFARYFPDFGFLIRARDPFAPFLLATPANSTPGLLNDEAHSWEQYSPFHSGGSPRARLAIFTILHSYSRKFSESGLNTGTD